MALTASWRPTREWPLLLLALALVAAVCLPLRQWAANQGDKARHAAAAAAGPAAGAWAVQRANEHPPRWSRMLLGPEQMVCYVAAAWAGLILLGRWWEVRRQRRAFGLGLLATEPGTCILAEDARLLQRRVEQTAAGRGPFILSQMIALALGKVAATRSGRDLSETVKAQADVELGRMVAGMATVHYLAWAIPAVGFLGTVRGLALSMSTPGDMWAVTRHLHIAFDATLVALALSLVLMFFLHAVQREEEGVVLDCQQYCLEHLVTRVYEPEPEAADGADVAHGTYPPNYTVPR